MSDENDLWECDKKKIIKEFSNPVGKLIKDIKVDVERQNVYDYGKNQGAVEELEKILDFFKEERFSIIFTDKLKNKLEERLKELKEGVEK
jgi:hypothetical protein